MEVITDFFQKLGNLEELIRWGGLTVLIIIVFAETGLLVGFFLTGRFFVDNSRFNCSTRIS